ncbi:MAG: alpha/beta hydrolase fold [Thermoleophilia bacterium]|nr:alpha/beta hydrolase fold [Thermoleophilia bacterium]
MSPDAEIKLHGVGTGLAAPTLLFLHAGVADWRSWSVVMPLVADVGAPRAYDRRGFGATPPASAPFRHLDDLQGVLERCGGEPAWLIGNSMGGALAIDAALELPERVAGLILLAPAVSGAPELTGLDPVTAELEAAIESADAAGDLARLNRLETRLWLDGPQQDGRVTGAARDLVLDMNALALRGEGPHDGASGLDAWARLEEIAVPTTVVWGEHEIPAVVDRCRRIVARVPHAIGHHMRGVAHLPSVERPADVAALVHAALRNP